MVATLMTAPEIDPKNPGGVSGETSTHKALGITTGVMYLTTASLAIAAPEGETQKKNKGLTKVHKALAFIHFPAMVAAPILATAALFWKYTMRKMLDVDPWPEEELHHSPPPFGSRLIVQIRRFLRNFSLKPKSEK